MSKNNRVNVNKNKVENVKMDQDKKVLNENKAADQDVNQESTENNESVKSEVTQVTETNETSLVGGEGGPVDSSASDTPETKIETPPVVEDTPFSPDSLSELINSESPAVRTVSTHSDVIALADDAKNSEEATSELTPEKLDGQEEANDDAVAEVIAEPMTENYPALGSNLQHHLMADTEVVKYANACATAFIVLKSIRDSNRDSVNKHLHIFCADFRRAVLDGRITRDSYARGLNRVHTVSVNQLTIFIGMIFEMFKNEVLLSDFKNGKSNLDRYFKSYPITANRAQAMELMTQIFLKEDHS